MDVRGIKSEIEVFFTRAAIDTDESLRKWIYALEKGTRVVYGDEEFLVLETRNQGSLGHLLVLERLWYINDNLGVYTTEELEFLKTARLKDREERKRICEELSKRAIYRAMQDSEEYGCDKEDGMS
jgi:hypothetical protein